MQPSSPSFRRDGARGHDWGIAMHFSDLQAPLAFRLPPIVASACESMEDLCRTGSPSISFGCWDK